eukprot:m51a1_g12362 hypothetical protein (357) ;mRNA; r:576405-577751
MSVFLRVILRTPASGFQVALLLAMLAALAQSSSYRDCADREFLYCGCATLGLIVAACLLATLCRGPRAQLAAEVFEMSSGLPALVSACLGVVSCAPSGVPVGPGSSSSGSRAAEGEGVAFPVPLFGLYVWGFTQISNMLLGKSLWPYLIPKALAVYLPALAVTSYLNVRVNSERFFDVTFCILSGYPIAVLFTALGNHRSRMAYRVALLREYECRISASRKEATDTLVQSIFPRDIADQLIGVWSTGASFISATLSTVQQHETATPIYNLSPLGNFPRNDKLVGKLTPSAAVYLSFANIEQAGDMDKQLQLASTLVIRLDSIASQHGVTKIYTEGYSVLYIAMSDPDHATALGESA